MQLMEKPAGEEKSLLCTATSAFSSVLHHSLSQFTVKQQFKQKNV